MLYAPFILFHNICSYVLLYLSLSYFVLSVIFYQSFAKMYPNSNYYYEYQFCFITDLLHWTASRKPLTLRATLIDFGLLTSNSCQTYCANDHSNWPVGILYYISPLQNYPTLHFAGFLKNILSIITVNYTYFAYTLCH